MSFWKWGFVICLFSFSVWNTKAQESPYVFFKSWENMGISRPIRDIFIGKDQALYGNSTKGFYRYDGNRWNWVAPSEGLDYFSFVHPRYGFFVAGYRFAQHYKPNEKGTYDTTDLYAQLPQAEKNAFQIFTILSNESEVYLVGNGGIFKWKENTRLTRIWKTATFAGCMQGDKLYFVDQEDQFVVYENGRMHTLSTPSQPLSGIGTVSVEAMQCSQKGQVYMGQRSDTALHYDGHSLTPLSFSTSTGAPVPLKVSRIYTEPSGNLIIRDGKEQLVRVNAQGKILQTWRFADFKVPLEIGIWDITVDREGRVWFTNAQGMGYIDLSRQVTVNNAKVSGIYINAGQIGNTWYYISQNGIYTKSLSGSWEAPFTKIYSSPNIYLENTMPFGNGGYITCEEKEVRFIQNGTAHKVGAGIPCDDIGFLPILPHHFIVSGNTKLTLYDELGNITSDIGSNCMSDAHTPKDDELFCMVKSTNLMAHYYKQFRFNAEGKIISQYRTPIIEHDVGEFFDIFYYHGQLYMSSSKRVLRVGKDKVTLATDIWQRNPNVNLNFIQPTSDGKLWLFAEDRSGYFLPENDHPNSPLKWYALPDRINVLNYTVSAAALPDKSVMFLSEDGVLLKIAPEAMKPSSSVPRVSVSAIWNVANSAMLYMGTREALSKTWQFKTYTRSLKFQLGYGLDMQDPSRVYQTWLEGEESTWGAWMRQAERQYSNLSGTYTLHVRMKDSFGRITETAFPFYVYPPWYARWWALLLWVALLGIGGYLSFGYMVQYRTRQYEARNQELEAKVQERTEVIARQTEELKSLDEAKTVFFANVSHEFRTPLTLISGWIQRLKKEKWSLKSEEGQQALAQMNEQTNNLQGLITQIMDLTKIEAKRFELNREVFDLTAVLHRFDGNFQSLADYKFIKLKTVLPRSPVYVSGDVSALEKIIGNLLTNAIKFTGKGGEVNLEMQMNKAGFAEVTVRDSGIGISPEDLPHIFERFYQAKTNRRKEGGGTGIGLALAHELALLHDGSLTATSTVGEGSTFVFSIPASHSELGTSESELGTRAAELGTSESELGTRESEFGTRAVELGTWKSELGTWKSELGTGAAELGTSESEFGTRESEFGTRAVEFGTRAAEFGTRAAEFGTRSMELGTVAEDRTRILVAEDQPDLRKFIVSLFASEYDVIEAEDGQDAVEKARTFLPDLVISDVMMPQMSGFEVAELLQKESATAFLPFIFLTARASDQDVKRGLALGAVDYVVKPFDLDVLQLKVKNLLQTVKQAAQGKMSRSLLKEEIATDDPTSFKSHVDAYIYQHLSDETLTIEGAIEEMGMGRTVFYKRFKQEIGVSPNSYMRSIRLQTAAVLLEKGSYSVTEVAYQVGFNSIAYFTKAFKEYFGMTPSAFMNKSKGETRP
jgi:signal transduction histidine kinase/AraC-like DNA-binding protein